MENAFTRQLSTPVPQREPADDRQVVNNAGGYTFAVDDKTRLERFLTLGTDGGTYYVTERDLTKQNVSWLIDLIKTRDARNYWMIHNTILDISTNGRAYRNSPAIFACALLLKYDMGASIHDEKTDRWYQTKETTRKLILKVCRTSTHLFEFAQYVEFLGGWGRAKRTAVAGWYTSKDTDQLAYQTVKYRQRNGWTHRDLFRLSHPKGVSQKVGNFILGKPEVVRENDEVVMPDIINGFVTAQAAENKSQILQTLDLFPNLPWEALPTQFLKEPEVWKKLFYNGQLNGQALVRNITRLARIRAFDDMAFARDYANRLTDEEMIRKTRLHPINYLNAVVVHEEGQIQRSKFGRMVYPDPAEDRKKDWQTVPVIVDALNEGFHLAFKHIEPAGMRTFIGLDVSSSMSHSAAFGLDLSAAQVGAATAMAIARTEPYYQVFGFTDGTVRTFSSNIRSVLTDLGISPGMSLVEVLSRTKKLNFGGTDCALPMLYAAQNKIEVDTFIVITDNETWYGRVHPHIALRNYRQKMGLDARLIVAGVSSTEFTIADPADAGMLDVVGFDANAPKVMADFSAGRI